MKFLQKNKILTLFALGLCCEGFSEVTIPKEKAYLQMAIDSELPILTAWQERVSEEYKTKIWIQLQKRIQDDQSYGATELPDPYNIPSITLDHDIDHITTCMGETQGHVLWRNVKNNTVEYVQVNIEGSKIVASEVLSIPGSSFSGDSLQATYDVAGHTAVTWNRKVENNSANPLSQFSLIDAAGSASTAVDGWTESNAPGGTYAEVPRAAYSSTASKWVFAQNFYNEDILIKSRVGNFSSSFTDSGDIPSLSGKPALVYQTIPHEGEAIISTAYSTHYTSDPSQAQLYRYDGTTLTPMERSFEARGVVMRFRKEAVVRLYYMDDINKFYVKTFSDFTFWDNQIPQINSDFWYDFFTGKRKMDYLAYKEMNNYHYYSVLTTDPVSKVNSVGAGNISLSLNRIKTHTRKFPDSTYLFYCQLFNSSFINSEHQQILRKKYESFISSEPTDGVFCNSNKLYQFFSTKGERKQANTLYQLTLPTGKDSTTNREAVLVRVTHLYNP